MINYKPVDLPERTVTVRNKRDTYVYLTQRVEYSSKLNRGLNILQNLNVHDLKELRLES